MPLTHDLEEAKMQNEILADGMLKAPQVLLGEDYGRLEAIVVILGVICQKKQSSPETLDKLAVIIANLSQN